jgi:small ligand-binding sensory domain FIST
LRCAHGAGQGKLIERAPGKESTVHWSSKVSDERVLEEAVSSVAKAVLEEMAGRSVDLAIVFVSRQFALRYKEVPQLLRAALPHRVLIGCSAGGVIGGGREVEQRAAISLTAAHLPGVEVTPFTL